MEGWWKSETIVHTNWEQVCIVIVIVQSERFSFKCTYNDSTITILKLINEKRKAKARVKTNIKSKVNCLKTRFERDRVSILQFFF